MFYMGQNQNKGVELENKVVEKRRYENYEGPANLY